jgi:hypothetical protein
VPGFAAAVDFEGPDSAEVDFEGPDSAEELVGFDFAGVDFEGPDSAEELVGFDFAGVDSEEPGFAEELGSETPDLAEADFGGLDLVEEPDSDHWVCSGFAWAQRA